MCTLWQMARRVHYDLPKVQFIRINSDFQYMNTVYSFAGCYFWQGITIFWTILSINAWTLINVTFSCQTFKLPTVQHYTEAVFYWTNHTLCNVLQGVHLLLSIHIFIILKKGILFFIWSLSLLSVCVSICLSSRLWRDGWT